VFKLSPSGTETVLHGFCSKPGCIDGSSPQAGLIADEKGNLYGTTAFGGASNGGMVFKLSPGGAYTILSCRAVSFGLKGIYRPMGHLLRCFGVDDQEAAGCSNTPRPRINLQDP
jgi:uncharacterized repeat protein (TIGR03803 family)